MSLSIDSTVLLHNGWNSIQYTIVNNRLLVAERTATFILPVTNNDIHQDTLYRVSLSDGSSFKATANHFLKIRSVGLNDWVLTSIEDIRNSLIRNPRIIPNQSFYCCFGNCRYIGPNPPANALEVEPIDYTWNFSQTPLCLLPPYWIGVFTIKGLLEEQEPKAILDPELRNIMEQHCMGLRQHHIVRNTDPNQFIHSFRSDRYIEERSQLSIDLENLELLYSNKCNRYIHDSYLYTSVDNRINLLRGLMDAGGYIDFMGGGTAKLRVFSSRLVENIYLLVRSLGGYVSVERMAGVWTLSILPPSTINPFSREGLVTNYKEPDISPVPRRFVVSVQEEGEPSSTSCLRYGSPSALVISKSITGLDYIASRC